MPYYVIENVKIMRDERERNIISIKCLQKFNYLAIYVIKKKRRKKEEKNEKLNIYVTYAAIN